MARRGCIHIGKPELHQQKCGACQRPASESPLMFRLTQSGRTRDDEPRKEKLMFKLSFKADPETKIIHECSMEWDDIHGSPIEIQEAVKVLATGIHCPGHQTPSVDVESLHERLRLFEEAAWEVRGNAYLDDDNVINRHPNTTVGCESLKKLFALLPTGARAGGGD